MVKKWMLNTIVALACLWLVYVLLHWTQLRVWHRLHHPIAMKFSYVVSKSISSVNTTPVDIKPVHFDTTHKSSLSNLPQMAPISYPTGTPTCKPQNLGPVKTPFSLSDLTGDLLTRARPLKDGVWHPNDCVPQERFAVIIPYRNRPDNLKLITNHLNFFLQQQQAGYGIFVVEQADKRLFNRAKLFNVAVKVIGRMFPMFGCFIFHDADKLPMDTRHIYRCNSHRPLHLISRMRTTKSAVFKRGMLYNNFFGGVTAVTKSMFHRINGMSNMYWGWGREDDDLCARLRIRGLNPQYIRDSSASYINVAHQNDVIVNKNPWPHMHMVRRTMDHDGLSSVNFTIRVIERLPLCTLISVYL